MFQRLSVILQANTGRDSLKGVTYPDLIVSKTQGAGCPNLNPKLKMCLYTTLDYRLHQHLTRTHTGSICMHACWWTVLNTSKRIEHRLPKNCDDRRINGRWMCWSLLRLRPRELRFRRRRFGQKLNFFTFPCSFSNLSTNRL